MMIGKSDRTIQEWKRRFFESGGKLPESKQGQYERTGVLWSNKSFNKKAARYIHTNASVKGKPNLTAHSFCQWVNEVLLHNETLEPGFPRKIGVETSRKWMHEMGYEVLTSKKGAYMDGHERDDVVLYRKTFLRRMVTLGFLNPANAPTDDVKECLPSDLHCPPEPVLEKTVIFSMMNPHSKAMMTNQHCEVRKAHKSSSQRAKEQE